MREMVERVALKIQAEAKSMSIFASDGAAIRLARAAIEAMREPTQAMVDACDLNIPAEGMIRNIWDDMIDEALK